jgi:hypothetical protein
MKEVLIQHMENFLNDFQYFRIEAYEAFEFPVKGGSKIVVLNATPYDDGLMVEIQLAIKINKIEEVIFSFYNQEVDKLSLTYWEPLSQIHQEITRRTFVQNESQLNKLLAELESALVKKGFGWLDALSKLEELSNQLLEVIYSSTEKHPNLYKITQRSYVALYLLGESMTEALFYKYYEQMQFHKIPEHQLEEFLEFKKFLDNDLFK